MTVDPTEALVDKILEITDQGISESRMAEIADHPLREQLRGLLASMLVREGTNSMMTTADKATMFIAGWRAAERFHGVKEPQ